MFVFHDDYFSKFKLLYDKITFFLSDANLEVLMLKKLSSTRLVVERFEISSNSGVVLQAVSGSPEITNYYSSDQSNETLTIKEKR